MITKILNILHTRLYYFITKVAAPFIKKDKNIVLFSSSGGRYFTGNAKSLFLYMKENTQLKCIWATSDRNLYLKLKEQYGGGSTGLFHTFDSLKLVLKAKTVVMTHGTSDMPYVYLGKKTNVIQTWHGTPVKKLGILDSSNKDANIKKFLKESERYTAFISSSKATSWALAACFGMDARKIYVTGQPRNDILFKENDRDKILNALYPDIPPYDHIILYAPTWREKENARFFPFDDIDWQFFESFLEKNKIVIFLRGHINDNIDYIKDSSRILCMNQDKVEDVQDVLNIFDLLITDYSSIYIDFLLLNRPIIYIPYDLKDYEKTRGLLYDYEHIAAGPCVSDFSQLIGSIEDFINNNDFYSESRARLNDFFNEYKDNKSSGRVYELIKNLL